MIWDRVYPIYEFGYTRDLQVIKHPILPGLDRQIQAKHVKTSQIQPRDGWSDDPAGTGGTIISLQLPYLNETADLFKGQTIALSKS